MIQNELMSSEEKEIRYRIKELEQDVFELLSLKEKNLRITLARGSLLEFTRYTMPEFRPSWHHELMCRYLDEFIHGDLDRLIISVPPRHGKSELVSRRLPAYLLGKNPHAKILTSSYSSDLAQLMNRDVQDIIDSDSYSDVFPKTRLAPHRGSREEKVKRDLTEFEVVGHRGYYRAVGVGGSLTGFGGNYGIIDDPIKNREQADSATYREAVWGWYRSTFYTRLEHPRKVAIVSTRWHEDDLVGRLLRQAENDSRADKWVELRIPALADSDLHPEDRRCEGEPLWPARFTREVYESIRVTVGSTEWQSLYQGRPTTPEGRLLRREYWQFYRDLPALDDWLISVDARFTAKADEGDYVVMQVWGRRGSQKYLVDQVRDRLSFTGTIEALRSLSYRYPSAYLKIIENKANGPAIESQIKNEISGIVLVEPRGDKVARVNSIMPTIEAGNVFLPDPSKCSWIEDFISECAEFPRSKHDDQVDAMSQALLRFLESETVSVDLDILSSF